MTDAPGTGRRLQFIDAARGSAMMFLLLSHFGYSYFQDQHDAAPLAMRLAGMVASPTFAAINGLLIGFLYRTQRADFDRIRLKLADRGLFLLSIGHVLIYWAHPAPLAVSVFLTDTIGACMIVCPWLVTRVRPRIRIGLGAACYAASWVVVALWHPHTVALKVLKETFFGTIDPSFYTYAFPFLPWFSLDFACSALGDRLAVSYGDGDTRGMQLLLGRMAAGALIAGLLLKAGQLLAKYAYHLAVPAWAAVLTSPFQKQPPAPAYFLCYGSIGLGLAAAWLALERRGWLAWARAAAVALGQAALVTLIIQWYVYFPLLHAVYGRLPFTELWPGYFLLSVGAIVTPGLAWRRLGYDRFVTLGFQTLRRHWHVRAMADRHP